MSITIPKSLLWRFFNIKIKQKVSTFPNLLFQYLELVNWMALLYYRLFNVHDFSKCFNFSPRRNHFSSRHSIKECCVYECVCVCVCEWGGWEAGEEGGTSYQIFKKGHNPPGLFIPFIQASLLSLFLFPGSFL